MRIRSRARLAFAVAATGLTAVAVIGPRVWTGAAAAVAVTQASAAATVPYAPYPATGTELYVDNAATSNCSDSGTGSQSQPFCTIAAAASAVQPGRTVIVEPGTYDGATISAQGTPSAPVTFNALLGATVTGPASAPPFTLSGARDVTLTGFRVFAAGAHPAFDVTGGSSGITINGGYAGGHGGLPSIEVEGTSSGVTVSRVAIVNVYDGPGVQVDSGASGVTITGNSVAATSRGVLVTDAPGTNVTGNTVQVNCAVGISLAGTSSGASVQNNIVRRVQNGDLCGGTAVVVSVGSEAGSVIDYNLIDPFAETLYGWGEAGYASLAAFQAASGQGAHDIAADPGLGTLTAGPLLPLYQGIPGYPLNANSPAIDSANPNAPGELRSDQFGSPRADDPGVANTGTGGGYYDRGALELEGGAASTPQTRLGSTVSSGPLTATFTTGVKPAWTSNGPLALLKVDFGDGTPAQIARATSIRHAYRTAGNYIVNFTDAMGCCDGGSSTNEVVVGANYTPVTPTRIMDTRTGTGTGKAAPIAAGGTLTLPIPTINGVPGANISAVVMNVTVTRPATAGHLTVYPGSGAVPTVSTLDFSAGETLPNLVTVQPTNGQVSFHNGSNGTVQVVADLEGFYGPGGYGFKPIIPAPTRVLDTRSGTGTGKAAPVAAGGRVRLNLSGKVPAGTAAVVMNVTVTQPRRGGYLTVYPDGVARPNASNLNFSAGETVPNLVIVPLRAGAADFFNSSGGTLQLVADLAGYFSAAAPDSFVPYGPTREADTRTGHGPLAPRATYTVNILNYFDCPCAATADAVVDNVTVTAPAKAGVLTVYPAGGLRPLASNLNFSAGQTVSNLVIVEGGNGKISFYNNSPGPLQLVIDEYGYYIVAS
jgi:hypothetical protein